MKARKRLFPAAFCLALLFFAFALRAEAGADTKTRILGGITPHHGIALDMITRFYEQISSEKILRVWLLSPDHFKRARNYAVACTDSRLFKELGVNRGVLMERMDTSDILGFRVESGTSYATIVYEK